MEKVAAHTPDLVQANIAAIAGLFPHVVTEALDAEGNVTRAIDFDALRQELSDHVVEGPRERYLLDWPGKRAAMLAANAPTQSTLRPIRDESVDFDTTKNLFIEGDNLEALKVLQESYLGKVKLIYIDPPYNTGNDFIYDDDFAESNSEYLARTGQVDGSGTRLVANTEANGRFHSDWLSMMYPRLKLARNLLADTGMLLVSINDAEAPRLRQVLDEIFGAANFLSQLIWMKGKEGGNDNHGFGQHHEYVIAYGRTAEAAKSIALDAKDTSRHRIDLPEVNRVVSGSSNYRSGEPFQLINLSKQKDYTVQIPLSDGSVVEWPSYAPQKTIDRFISEGRIFVGIKGVPYVKSFLADEAAGSKPSSVIDSAYGTTKAGGIAIRDLFGSSKVFSYPKPPSLIRRLIQIAGVGNDDIVLDFFAGSGSTAQAVLEENAKDGLSRRFILVQIDEPVPNGSELNSLGFVDVASFCRERVRRSARVIGERAGLAAPGLDLGFRALRLDSSSYAEVLETPDETVQVSLDLLSDSVKPERTDLDLIFQILVDSGLPLSLPIELTDLDGQEIIDVDGGALVACFATDLNLELARSIAQRLPIQAVFRDSSFRNDAERINYEQIFRELSPDTQLKVV